MKNGTIIPVSGEAIEIVASSASTNYTFVIGVQTSPQAADPPPHRHLGEDEMFTVIDGEYEFFDGTAWTTFRRGEVRGSRRANHHGLRNIGNTDGRLVFMTNGGGLDDGGGLDECFAEISPLHPQDMERLNESSRFYRYEYLQSGS